MPCGIQGLAEVARQVSVEVEVAIGPTKNEAQRHVAEQIGCTHNGVVDTRVFQTVVPCDEEAIAHREAFRAVARVPEPNSNGDCNAK